MAESDRGCSPRRDFLRHIAMPAISRIAGEFPPSVIEDAKKWLSNAENKYRFSIYGGDPKRVIEYLYSEDWRDFVTSLKGSNAERIAEEILRALVEAYKEECPEVAGAASRALESLAGGDSGDEGGLDLDTFAGLLREKLGSNYSVTVKKDDNKIIVEGSEYGVRAELAVKQGNVKVKACAEASTGASEAATLIRELSKLVKKSF